MAVVDQLRSQLSQLDTEWELERKTREKQVANDKQQQLEKEVTELDKTFNEHVKNKEDSEKKLEQNGKDLAEAWQEHTVAEALWKQQDPEERKRSFAFAM